MLHNVSSLNKYFPLQMHAEDKVAVCNNNYKSATICFNSKMSNNTNRLSENSRKYRKESDCLAQQRKFLR